MASVLHQRYERWELSLCDDASGDETTREALLELEHSPAFRGRLIVTRRAENGGIAAATNDAVAASGGEYVAFLDQDDLLAPDALERVAEEIEHGRPDLLYTDQDILAPNGERIEPYFKSAWNPDLLLSNMYLGHLLVVRRTLFDRVGGLRPTHDGSQDYDLALRATELANEVRHVPTVGYHWRRTAGSTASDYHQKPQADLAARRALADALDRRDVSAVVEDGRLPSTFRVRRLLQGAPHLRALVSAGTDASLLRRSIDALMGDGDVGDVWLVRRDIEPPEVLGLLRTLERAGTARVVSAAEADAETLTADLDPSATLLLLSARVELRPGANAALQEHAQRAEVGAVGGRIVDEQGRLHHAGVVPGLQGRLVGLPFTGCAPGNDGYWGHTRLIRNWSAVSGICLMSSVAALLDIGGLDLTVDLAVAGVRYCLAQREAGRLVVFTPFAEGVLHAQDDDVLDLGQAPLDLASRDPYFHPAFDPRAAELRLPDGVDRRTGYNPSNGARNAPV